MLHIRKLDRRCTDLQMKEHNRALMNGDPWMVTLRTISHGREDKEDKEKKSTKSQTVETA